MGSEKPQGRGRLAREMYETLLHIEVLAESHLSSRKVDPAFYEIRDKARAMCSRVTAWGKQSPAQRAGEGEGDDDIESWADHANRVCARERVIDGHAYVPAIEAYAVISDLKTMQRDGPEYEPVERDGVYRWVPSAQRAGEPTPERDALARLADEAHHALVTQPWPGPHVLNAKWVLDTARAALDAARQPEGEQ